MAHMKAVEINDIYHQYSTTRIMNLIIIKITNLDGVTAKRNLNSDKEVSYEKNC